MDGQAVSSDAPDTSKLIVEFYEDAILDEKATNGWTEEQFDYQTQQMKVIRHQGAGREVWKSVDFVEIRIPMNLKEIRRRQVRESDKQKWPREWAAYQQTKTNPAFGTPLEKLPFLTKAQVNWSSRGWGSRRRRTSATFPIPMARSTWAFSNSAGG
jgi:hypothetical protein